MVNYSHFPLCGGQPILYTVVNDTSPCVVNYSYFICVVNYPYYPLYGENNHFDLCLDLSTLTPVWWITKTFPLCPKIHPLSAQRCMIQIPILTKLIKILRKSKTNFPLQIIRALWLSSWETVFPVREHSWLKLFREILIFLCRNFNC